VNPQLWATAEDKLGYADLNPNDPRGLLSIVMENG
jgi:hypothetical protein